MSPLNGASNGEHQEINVGHAVVNEPDMKYAHPVSRTKETHKIGWGSDVVAEVISRLDLRYIALNPGSSYRGLHDSIVNYNGNSAPQMITCLHEEHAIAVAHGYAKVTERPMACAIHANVGLMHCTMAIYNAFNDRVPMLILGATGPLDDGRRRPWIDWIHTCTDQAALARPFLKFDEQPNSIPAAARAVLRCYQATVAKPSAPTYVTLDVCLQEDSYDPSQFELPNLSRLQPTPPPGPEPAIVSQVVELLASAKRPLFLFGRVNRTTTSWKQRVSLAEHVDARVITDLKQGAAFPTYHPLHPVAPGVFTPPQAAELIRAADLIISFDWVDLAGTLQAANSSEPEGKVVHISLDSSLYNGWSKDHFGLATIDVQVPADPDKTLDAILNALKGVTITPKTWTTVPATVRQEPAPSPDVPESAILMKHLASGLFQALNEANQEYCLVRLPLGWRGPDLNATGPLSFLGMDGAAGLGSGPGMTVGAALALKGTPVLAVSVLGDGDTLMGCNALWTAARYRLPCLIIIANNGSFYNDEVHQTRVALHRDRPAENDVIGQRIDDPQPDLNSLATSMGLSVPGPKVTTREHLIPSLRRAVALAQEGRPVLLDIGILPDGYSTALEQAR
jgi:thiamine pyrophosphate-dependent acetolactate synthase large subunit-like protein